MTSSFLGASWPPLPLVITCHFFAIVDGHGQARCTFVFSSGPKVARLCICLQIQKWQLLAQAVTFTPGVSIELPGLLKRNICRKTSQMFPQISLPYFDANMLQKEKILPHLKQMIKLEVGFSAIAMQCCTFRYLDCRPPWSSSWPSVRIAKEVKLGKFEYNQSCRI